MGEELIQLILEIAVGVILGLAGFGWLKRWHRALQLRAISRQLENVKAEIMRGFNESIRAIEEEQEPPSA